jgi:lipoyl(octanoyl) transferase
MIHRGDSTIWRLIDTGHMSGVENMAIDEALLSCFHPGKSRPVLRLYGWSPPAFSYGRFQKPEEIIDLKRCRADNVQTVRRITGGGVIYHAGEITYSLVCPADFIPGVHGVKEAFFHLTSFLLAFYRSLGLKACHAAEHYPGSRRLGERTSLCFAGIESCDILIHGKKIGGNAQRRLKDVIFQHGSIPLRQMAVQGNRYLLHPDTEVSGKTTSLADEGINTAAEALAVNLKESFEHCFEVTFDPCGLTGNERERAAGYMQETE